MFLLAVNPGGHPIPWDADVPGSKTKAFTNTEEPQGMKNYSRGKKSR